MTTNEITNDQIRKLRDAAAVAGDHHQIALCDLALRGEIDPDVAAILGKAECDAMADHYGVPGGARDACARFIDASAKLADAIREGQG